MRVVTFNVRYGSATDGANDWNHRREIFFECIRGMQPDIMGVQECLSFQAEEIKERFPSLDHFGLGRYHNTQTSRSHELYSGEHCTIFYDLNAYALERTGTFWLSDTPEVAGSSSWGNGLPRIATWGILRHRESGKRLAVFNTHYDTSDNPTFGANSTRLIRTRIRDIARAVPVILMGDFNLRPDSEAHRSYVSELTDVWTAMKMPEEKAGSSHSFTGRPENRIDWMLVSPELEALSIQKITYNVEGRYPSDHFPLLAVLKLR